MVQDYFPDLLALDCGLFRSMEEITSILSTALGTASSVSSMRVPVPSDCVDGFLGAFWRRPHSYLDPEVRAGMSSFARVTDAERRIECLAADLASGAWERRYGALCEHADLDIGYRLIVANWSVRNAA